MAPASATETMMTACPGLSIRSANGTLMARQGGGGGLARWLGSKWTGPLTWGFGLERATVIETA